VESNHYCCDANTMYYHYTISPTFNHLIQAIQKHSILPIYNIPLSFSFTYPYMLSLITTKGEWCVVIYDIGIMSNATRILGTSTTKAIARGNIPVQQKTIRLSYRIRGRVARNQTKRKQKAQVLRPKTILCRLMNVSLINSSGML
jgi:hypothetical protein